MNLLDKLDDVPLHYAYSHLCKSAAARIRALAASVEYHKGMAAKWQAEAEANMASLSDLMGVEGMLDMSVARIRDLEAQLADIQRKTNCPRPMRHRPEEFTAEQCIAAGECGCVYGRGTSATACICDSSLVTDTSHHQPHCPRYQAQTPVQVVCPCGFSCNKGALKPNEYCWRDRQAAGLAQETACVHPRDKLFHHAFVSGNPGDYRCDVCNAIINFPPDEDVRPTSKTPAKACDWPNCANLATRGGMYCDDHK
jgi:hypothetical protein